VELHPMQLPDLIAQGNARAVVNQRPRTITEILQDARRQMEITDAVEDWLAGRPVPQLRHPRRTLRQWLTGRKPEPALGPPPMTEVVTWLRSEP
jgi:hypothetical protein